MINPHTYMSRFCGIPKHQWDILDSKILHCILNHILLFRFLPRYKFLRLYPVWCSIWFKLENSEVHIKYRLDLLIVTVMSLNLFNPLCSILHNCLKSVFQTNTSLSSVRFNLLLNLCVKFLKFSFREHQF